MTSRKNNRKNRIAAANHEGSWAVSYVDMLTVVLCFFIVFFNSDKIKVSKSLRSIQQIKADIGGVSKLDCEGNGGASREGCSGTRGPVPGSLSMSSGAGAPGKGGGMVGFGTSTGTGTELGASGGSGGAGQGRAPASIGMGEAITRGLGNFFAGRGTGSGGGVGNGSGTGSGTGGGTGNGKGPGAGSHMGEGASGYGEGTAGGVATGTNVREILGHIELDHSLVSQNDLKESSLEIDFEGVSFFKSGSTKLTPEGEKTIRHVVKVLMPYKDKIKVVVQGHTDSTKSNGRNKITDNWELSVIRATSVLKLLKAEGFPQNQLSAEGFADTRHERAIASDAPLTPQELAKQRRITLRVEELNHEK